MKNYNEYINEGLLAAMKPKSKEEIGKAVANLFNNTPDYERILNLVFKSNKDDNILPIDINLFNEDGKKGYNQLLMVYNLVKEFKSILTNTFIYKNVIQFDLVLGIYKFQWLFSFDDMEVMVDEIPLISGDDYVSFELDFDVIENNFKIEFKEALEKASEKVRESISDVDKAIKNL